MNYRSIKRKMNRFFKNTSAEDLKKQMEDIGYQFEQIDSKRGNCAACAMEKAGVKSRKRLPHTCEGSGIVREGKYFQHEYPTHIKNNNKNDNKRS